MSGLGRKLPLEYRRLEARQWGIMCGNEAQDLSISLRSAAASVSATVAQPLKRRQSTRVNRRNFTIDDVAKEAGVARVTVSRVLNNVQNVRPETRDRVRRAVEALGYSVNRQARALASGSGTQVMLIHAHHPEREPNSF